MRLLAALTTLAIACSGSSKTVDRPDNPDKPDGPGKPAAPITDEQLVDAKVAAVELRGLERIGESRARLALELRAGDPFDRTKIRESLRKLMTIRGVGDARAVAFRTGDGGIGVAFVITETARITRLDVTGNKTVGAGELLGLAKLAVGEPMSPAAAQRAAILMKARYLGAGFLHAEIDWKASEDGAVIFTVREGKRVSISKITLTKPRALSSARLNNILLKASAENTVGGVYSPQAFEDGITRITAAYYDVGHINARIGPHTTTSPTPETIEITIPIDEGPQFKLGKLEVTGKLAAPAKTYLRQIKIRRGQIFSRTEVGDAITKLIEFHKSRSSGSDPVITPLTDVDVDKKKIDIKFEFGS